MKQSSSWDRWDDQGVAEDIDRYWSADPSGYEAAHRTILLNWFISIWIMPPREYWR
jgi:hypothetical protein